MPQQIFLSDDTISANIAFSDTVVGARGIRYRLEVALNKPGCLTTEECFATLAHTTQAAVENCDRQEHFL